MKNSILAFAFALVSHVGFAQCTGFSVELVETIEGTVGTTDLSGYHVYHVYADFQNESDFLSSLYALENDPEKLEVISEFPCYKSSLCGLLGNSINASQFILFPELFYTTFLTINMLDSQDPGYLFMLSTNPITTLVNNMVWGDISIEDGAIFTTADQPNGIAVDSKVFVGQITTQGGFTFNSCVQTFANGNQSDIHYGCFSVTAKAGCTNPLSSNYNPNATHDDGSCMEVILGCMDAEACNYDETAIASNETCQYPGCNDELACNYDPSAVCFDNDLCEFVAPKAIEGPFNVDATLVYQYTYPADDQSTVTWEAAGGVVTAGQGTTNVSVVWDSEFAGFPYGQIAATETNVENCSGETVIEMVTVTYVGVDEFSSQEISIYPNPASDILTIQPKIPFNQATILVYSSVGQLVMTFNNLSNSVFTMSVEDLAPGSYTVMIQENGTTVSLPCQIVK